MSAHDPYADKRDKLKDAAENADALEEMHIRNLVGSPDGRWLLRDLIDQWEKADDREPSANSWDMFHAGVRKATNRYRKMLIKHLGKGALALLEEK